MTDPNPTNIVVANLGRKGTGKSTLLHRLYTSKKDRVLSIGCLPQDLARDPDVVVVMGLGPLLDRLKWLPAHGYERWHLATELEPADMAELCSLLVPPLGSQRPSLSEAFNGMALAINELYDVAPNQGTPEEVARLPRVARHKLLDIYAAASRPAVCSRDFTAAADHLYLFAQSEANDLDYIAKTCGKPVARLVSTLAAHEFVHYDRTNVNGATAKHYDAAGRYLSTLSRPSLAATGQNSAAG